MKNFARLFGSAVLLTFFFSCSSSRKTEAPPMSGNDPYLWLEDVNSQKSMDWVLPHNKKSFDELTNEKSYAKISKQIRKIVTSKDRIPYVAIVNGKYKNFWQDENHLRGIVRVTTATEYKKKNPKWETILDIDALNKKEGKSWVYRGMHSLPPENTRALVLLSDGGSDKEVIREFNTETRSFVENGFVLPEAKSEVSWLDKNTLILGTDFGAGTLTKSGYPKQVRLWKRGTPFTAASIIYEGKDEDVSVNGYSSIGPDTHLNFVSREISTWESENYLYDEATQKLSRIPFPKSARFQGNFKNYLLASLRHDWKTTKGDFSAGSLISLPADKVGAPDAENYIELVYEPDARSTLHEVAMAKSYLLLGLLSNVRGEIMKATHLGDGWKLDPMTIPDNGEASILDSDRFTNLVLVGYQNFTTPPSLYRLNLADSPIKTELLKSLPSQYNSQNVVTEQKEAVSKDGTKVPYFLVYKKGLKLDGKNPTLLYGYGGFEHSLTPFYLGARGKVWIEHGGVFALANIRGGGEFGPKWHEAALKGHRQRAYDDFIAISEALIHSGLTSPRHLGIHGGSNGGLLVGVAFTERPDLYQAVLCDSALLDMLRYQKLPPGASWMGEYGNPDVPEEAAYIAKYSPYQNVKPNTKYPRVFFYTSTGDDRVQPGHTRKMVAKMEALGNDVLLYENTEGGHGAAADLEESIKKAALQYTYLFKQLK